MFAIVCTPEHMARAIGQNTLAPHTITHGLGHRSNTLAQHTITHGQGHRSKQDHRRKQGHRSKHATMSRVMNCTKSDQVYSVGPIGSRLFISTLGFDMFVRMKEDLRAKSKISPNKTGNVETYAAELLRANKNVVTT